MSSTALVWQPIFFMAFLSFNPSPVTLLTSLPLLPVMIWSLLLPLFLTLLSAPLLSCPAWINGAGTSMEKVRSQSRQSYSLNCNHSKHTPAGLCLLQGPTLTLAPGERRPQARKCGSFGQSLLLGLGQKGTLLKMTFRTVCVHLKIDFYLLCLETGLIRGCAIKTNN